MGFEKSNPLRIGKPLATSMKEGCTVISEVTQGGNLRRNCAWVRESVAGEQTGTSKPRLFLLLREKTTVFAVLKIFARCNRNATKMY